MAKNHLQWICTTATHWRHRCDKGSNTGDFVQIRLYQVLDLILPSITGGFMSHTDHRHTVTGLRTRHHGKTTKVAYHFWVVLQYFKYFFESILAIVNGGTHGCFKEHHEFPFIDIGVKALVNIVKEKTTAEYHHGGQG